MSTAPATLESIAAQLDDLLARTAGADRRFLSVAATAAYCDLSEESIRRLLASGKLSALRPVKGKIVIDRRELDAYVLSSNARPRKGRGLMPRAAAGREGQA